MKKKIIVMILVLAAVGVAVLLLRNCRVRTVLSRGSEEKRQVQLSNPNATDEAKRLYAYLDSVTMRGVISGQQESTWKGSPDYEMDYIFAETGKYPAIRGLDFMGDDFQGVVERAKDWAQKGGIVTICWHCSSAFDEAYDRCKADELTAEEWEAVLTPGTHEHAAFLAAMDRAADALNELQQSGIPVLWRPFHEFDGAWFWWGKGGAETFKRLWCMMYDHFTNDRELNNLIWVLGYSHNGTLYGEKLADWYPGENYCDIAGADTYEVSKNGAEGRLYRPVLSATKGKKPLAMHENGLIPTVRQFKSVPWIFFMTWHTDWMEENSPEHLRDVYQSDYVITLDELPNLY